MKTRVAYSKADFSAFFAAHGASAEIVEEVWKALKDASLVEGFKPHPEDGLLQTFGLADVDLDDDIVLPILKRHNCRIPSPQETEAMKPVETVADLVDFISEMQKAAR